MSSDQQEDSVPQQTEWAQSASAREGVQLVARFVDEAKRGHDTRRRTEFHAMLEFCKAEARRGQAIDAIVCYHSNRFSRADSQETNWYYWEYRKAGVGSMLTAQRWYRFDRMEDRILLGIEQDATNNKWSIDHAEITTRGKLATVKDGFFAGGPVPYGYRVRYPASDRPSKRKQATLVVEPEQAAVVRWLFATYAAGVRSLWDLVLDLNGRGVEPPSAAWRRKRKARGWNHRTLRKILTNEVYLGHNVWNRRHSGKFVGVVDLRVTHERARPHQNDPADHVRRENTWPALVDPETFAACARLLAARKNGKGAFPKGGGFALSGVLVCGQCEQAMTGKNIRYRGKDPAARPGYRRYVCRSYFDHGKAVCNYNAIDEAPLLAALARKLEERTTPEFLDAFRAAALAEAGTAGDADAARRAALEADLPRLERDLDGAADAILREKDERLLERLRSRFAQWQDQHATVKAELARLGEPAPPPDPQEVIDETVELVRALGDVLARGTPAEVRAVLSDNLDRVEVFFDHSPAKGGRETKCDFARGLVWVREDSPFATMSEQSMQAVQEARHGAGRLLEPHRRGGGREEAGIHPGVPEQGGGPEELEGVHRGPRLDQGEGRVGEGRDAGGQGRVGVPQPDGLLAHEVTVKRQAR
jgi:hypothetical protein